MKNPFEGELERLARALTEKFGVGVVCQGDQAWTDGKRIVVPSVPDPMDEALERMMIGYLDHELAHVAFSEFDVAAEFERKHPGWLGILNVVEDALIERKAMQRWPGVRRNLDLMFRQIKPRIEQLIRHRDPFDRFCTAVYLRLSHHQDMMGLDRELAGYEDLLDRFPQAGSTRDAAELAELILDRWQKRAAQRQSQRSSQSACPDQAGGEESQKPTESECRSDDGCAAPSDRGGDGSCGRPADSSPTAGRQDERPGAPEESLSGDDKGDEGRTSAESPTPDSNAAGADGAAGCPGEQGSSGTAAGGQGVSLIAEALREAIEQQIGRIDASVQYRPYTREHDRIELVVSANQSDVEALLNTGQDTVRRLRRGLANALRAAEKRWWRDDQLRGELSPRTLHRLSMDRPRLDVFRVRSLVQGKSTAVSVLLDASGSMSSRKMTVARDAMRVLLDALHDLKIPTEALTFTTGNAVDVSQVMQQTGLDAHKLRERYGRLSNLEIGLIKRFDEPVHAALSRLPNVQGSGLTPLGEALQIAAARLIPRRETRRILLVLTDGKAGCEGGGEAATRHAHETATRITKTGIELIGVGILDDNIREVVAESIVIGRIEDLPAQLCKLLGRTLMKGVHRVG